MKPHVAVIALILFVTGCTNLSLVDESSGRFLVLSPFNEPNRPVLQRTMTLPAQCEAFLQGIPDRAFSQNGMFLRCSKIDYSAQMGFWGEYQYADGVVATIKTTTLSNCNGALHEAQKKGAEITQACWKIEAESKPFPAVSKRPGRYMLTSRYAAQSMPFMQLAFSSTAECQKNLKGNDNEFVTICQAQDMSEVLPWRTTIKADISPQLIEVAAEEEQFCTMMITVPSTTSHTPCVKR